MSGIKVLLTGGSGFIGSHVLRYLKSHARVKNILSVSRYSKVHTTSHNNDNLFVTTMPLDLTDFKSVKHVVQSFGPDIIFHLAAIPVVKTDSDNPTEITKTNILATHNLLASIQPKKKPVFAYTSSIVVYGLTPEGILNHEASPHFITSVYAATKLASEHLIQCYANNGIIEPRIFRLGSTVGVGATHGVVPDIIRKLKSESPYLELLGEPPGSAKPYTYVGDSANFMVIKALYGSSLGNEELLNVSVEGKLNILDLAEVIMNTSGIRKPIKWLGESGNWKGDIRNLEINCYHAKRHGWSPTYSSSEKAVEQATKEILSLTN